jgi:nicotinate-nucleotide adenylyltransferase
VKVGLFGGSFNPIHTGHLIVIDQAIEQLGLDKIVVRPAACNPLKINDTDMASPGHRMTMALLATKDLWMSDLMSRKVEVSNMEIMRGAPSYTIDTVRELKKNGDEIVLIIGGDSYNGLPQWKNIEELASMVTFGVAERKYSVRCPSVETFQVSDGNSAFQIHSVYRLIKTTTIDIPTFDTSGTEVRGRIKEGRSIKYLVPDVVEKYIRMNGLYLTSK